MASWISRDTPVPAGTPPYDWSSATKFECTWFAYYRVQEGSGLAEPPCWYSGSGSSGYGLYTNAKDWLDHYRDPWQVIPVQQFYKCKAGDIIVFTGNYGHVVVVEKVNADGTLCVSDYNLIGGTHAFGYKTDYRYPERIIGASTSTGACIGVLHNPNITTNIARYISAISKNRNRRKRKRYTNYVKL